MPITTQKNHLDYIKKSNTFFQDWAFDHKVAFKCLHIVLQPFTNISMHKKGVWSSNDV